MALLVDRLDLRPDGTYRGLRGSCVLNARRTDESIAAATYWTAVMLISTGLARQALGGLAITLR
jgi:hypothetical protein